MTDDDLTELVARVIEKLQQKEKSEDNWVTAPVAMKMLGIRSKTSLQKLRDTMAIKFSQPAKRIILYSTQSIHDYLERHAQHSRKLIVRK